MKSEEVRVKRHFSLFNLHCSLSVLLAGMIALAATIAQAETYYWNASANPYTSANTWATADGSKKVKLENSAEFKTYENDDFVVKVGKAITTSGAANREAYYFNTKTLKLEGASSRFYYRGKQLYNCNLVLGSGSVLYCWGRHGDRDPYASAILNSSIGVDSAATRDAPGTINVSKGGSSNITWPGATSHGINIQCPISGSGALLLKYDNSSRMALGNFNGSSCISVGLF